MTEFPFIRLGAAEAGTRTAAYLSLAHGQTWAWLRTELMGSFTNG